MNDNQRVNVVIPENYNGTPIQIEIRHGEAPDQLAPKEPEKIKISGTIDSPLRWIEKRREQFEHGNAHIIVDRNKIALVLIINETDFYQSQIGGFLQVSEKFKQFGINQNKCWEPKALSQFFKMNRAFFTDKNANMQLVTELKHFKANINQQVEKLEQENGSRTDHFSQVVDSNLPASFKVNLPLFVGCQPEEIEVEIYANVDGRHVELTLVSPAAEELLEEYRNKVIDEQLQQIQQIAPDIVIIEQ